MKKKTHNNGCLLYQKLMFKARRVNIERDIVETEAGFQAPTNGTAWTHLRTAMEAIRAGIACEDWSCVAEGQAMLERIEWQLRPGDYKATTKPEWEIDRK